MYYRKRYYDHNAYDFVGAIKLRLTESLFDGPQDKKNCNTVCIQHCECWEKSDVHTPVVTPTEVYKRHTPGVKRVDTASHYHPIIRLRGVI